MTRQREHWRSLEQVAGTPEARAFLEREFPEGASELPEGIDRRSLVQLLGASLSLAGSSKRLSSRSARSRNSLLVPRVSAWRSSGAAASPSLLSSASARSRTAKRS